MEKKKILITGAAGYIGGRLAQYMSGRPDVDIVHGSRKPDLLQNLFPGTEIVETKWDDPGSIASICAGIDAIVHAAGMNTAQCVADPAGAICFNGAMTARLLNAAVKNNVRRFIYLSTAHVYGSPLPETITEETCPGNLHPYASSHRAGEDAVRYGHSRGIIEGTAIRLSNAFGPPAHSRVSCWGLVINDLCRQAVTSGKMILKSTGQQRRDFITMTDVCRAIDHLMELPEEKLYDGLFNVGGEWAPTIREAAVMIKDLYKKNTGHDADIIIEKNSSSDKTEGLTYCIDRLKATGFQPQKKIPDEISDIFRFCQSNFKSDCIMP